MPPASLITTSCGTLWSLLLKWIVNAVSAGALSSSCSHWMLSAASWTTLPPAPSDGASEAGAWEPGACEASPDGAGVAAAARSAGRRSSRAGGSRCRRRPPGGRGRQGQQESAHRASGWVCQGLRSYRDRPDPAACAPVTPEPGNVSRAAHLDAASPWADAYRDPRPRAPRPRRPPAVLQPRDRDGAASTGRRRELDRRLPPWTQRSSG